MKKIIVRGIIILLILIVLGVVAASLFLDDAVKRAIETVGPKLTKTTVTLNTVKLSLLSGAGAIDGLTVGNPQGYKAPTAISIGAVRLGLKPESLLSDKIVIKGLAIESPTITLETDLKHDNLQQILDNLDAATSGGTNDLPTAKEKKEAGRKLEVDDLLITDGKILIRVTGTFEQSATVSLKQIRLSNLGTGPDGITAVELSKVILRQLEQSAVQAGTGAISDIKKGAIYFSKEPLKAGSNTVEKATKPIEDLFKKD